MKVVAWRIISISLTMLITFAVTGDLRAATTLTLVLHTILVMTHYLFESVWKSKYENKNISGG
jgi:uncharacterized membrane protein